MKFFISIVFFFAAFLLLIELPGQSIARPNLPDSPKLHEEWQNCGTWCEPNCDDYPGPLTCIAMCKRGYFCESNYVRETPGGRCILLSDCPARSSQ